MPTMGHEEGLGSGTGARCMTQAGYRDGSSTLIVQEAMIAAEALLYRSFDETAISGGTKWCSVLVDVSPVLRLWDSKPRVTPLANVCVVVVLSLLSPLRPPLGFTLSVELFALLHEPSSVKLG